MSGDPSVNEWTLLWEQFDALERSDNIEDIFDIEFRNRLSQLINRFAAVAEENPLSG